MSNNEQRLLNNEEIASVSGANGVIAGPNGEGCIAPLGWPFNVPPIVTLPVLIEKIGT